MSQEGFSTDDFTRSGFESWSSTSQFRRLLGSTQTEVRQLFEKHSRVNIAVSGGKDSLVMLHLALALKSDCFVWHWDYGIYMPAEIEAEVVVILRQHFHLIEPQLMIDRRMSRNPESKAGYRAFFKAVSDHLARNAVTLNLIGLRAEESCARKRRCASATEQQGHVLNYFPLRAWRWRDIWAYLISRQIPYPKAYDVRGPFLGWDKVRFVTFFDPEFEHLGGEVQDKFFFWRVRA